MASMKKGSIAMIMSKVALLGPSGLRRIKNSGMPISPPLPKQMICRFVRLRNTFVLIFERSLGAGT